MAPPAPIASQRRLEDAGLDPDRTASERADHWPYYAHWQAENERDAYAEWLTSWADWTTFATLTYDPKRYPWCPSDQEAARDFKAWLSGLAGLAPVRIRSMGAIEHHASGWPHVHALLGWPQRAPATADLNRAKSALYTPWFNAHGYADVRPVGGADRAAAYVAKYTAKTLSDSSSPGILIWPDPITSRGAWSG